MFKEHYNTLNRIIIRFFSIQYNFKLSIYIKTMNIFSNLQKIKADNIYVK